jgi:predicted transcriptional regulator
MLKATAKQLERLGLSEKDAEVYLMVLKLGVARAADIARQIDLPRQTVYSILESLLSIGLIDQHDRRGIKHFSAEPRRILEIIKREREQLAEAEHEVENELPELETIRFRPAALPKIQYYEGREGLKRLLEDILTQHKKGEKIFRGYGVNMMEQALGDSLFAFIKKRGALGVKTRLFIGQGPDDLALEKGALGREVKRLDIPAQDAALYIAGDRVYLFSYLDSVGLVLENRAIAKLLKATFDDHWQRT